MTAPGRTLALFAAMVVVVTAMVAAAEPDDPVLVGAGDIAGCGSSMGDEETATLLDGIAGTVFTAGDNAYSDGTLQEYNDCYHPTWGRHRARTKPSPGNHDWHTPGLQGYFDYFNGIVGQGQHWYSYDLGSWHIISLDSMCSDVPGGCYAGSPQEQWLRADLAATSQACIAAYWHHPRFSSGDHGTGTDPAAFWDALYEAGADLVLNGHDHDYERFAKQNPQGIADPNGIREFVVGTGGASQRPFNTPEPNSERRITGSYGVIKLTLHHGSYEWEFVTPQGALVTDTGSDTCNGESGAMPDTSILSGPAAHTTENDAMFTFSSSVQGSTFQCALNGAAWQSCVSPKGYSGIGIGTHTFQVRAVKDGLVDPSPASWSWTVRVPDDPPETTITQGPYRTTLETYATFTFTSSKQTSTFACQLDAGAWAACDSPHEVDGLAAGEHTFEVRATDPLGNTDPSPAIWAWTVQPHLDSLIAEIVCLVARLTDPDPPVCIV